MEMSMKRRDVLMLNKELPLLQQEIDAGYHFCPDWDSLVIGPDDPEIDGCTCNLGDE